MIIVVHRSSSARGDGTVVERHLTDAVPLVTDEIGDNLASPEGTTVSQGVLTFSDKLIAGLDAADVMVIGRPLDDFDPPATLKPRADLIARGGRTFEYGEHGPAGTLCDHPAHIVAASGGAPIVSPVAFGTTWMTAFLGWLGIRDVTTAAASSIMSDPEGIMAHAHAQGQELVAGGSAKRPSLQET